jgi:hypothetical protein
MASNEIAIQSGIIDYLYLKKHFFVRLNNIPPVQTVNGKMVFRRLPKGSVKGLPDILVLTDGGYAVFLEVKDKSKQSPDQIEFQRNCKEKGCEYHIVRSIDDVKNIGL